MNENLKMVSALALGLLPFSANQVMGQASASEEKKPNILFILSDDHTSQAWGIYGGVLADYVQNSNIKRLAAEGVTLDGSYCTNSISTPSRAAILTGKYSHRNGVYTLDDTLSINAPTLVTNLHEAGYKTAVIGKWHLGSQPQGFDYYSVFHDQGEYVDPTFMTTGEVWRMDKNYGERVRGFSTDIVTDKAIKWMQENSESSAPFYLSCHFKATHEPYDFPHRMRQLYEGVTFPEPDNLFDWGPETNGRTFEGQYLETIAKNWMYASDYPEEWWCRYPELPFSTVGMQKTAARKATYQKLIRDYLRCGAAIDDNIGKLLDALDEMGIADNTIVVYVSDQGYFLGEHGFYDKRIFYEESARMPFVIRYPNEIPANKRLGDLILNVDFAPTLADYAGVKLEEDVHGKSFRKNLVGQTPKEWRKSIYYRYWTHHDIRPAHMGIRNERYKLIFFYGDYLNMTGSSKESTVPSWEFYDLKVDASENCNVYSNPKYGKIIRAMKKEMLLQREELGDTDANSERMKEIMNQWYY